MTTWIIIPRTSIYARHVKHVLTISPHFLDCQETIVHFGQVTNQPANQPTTHPCKSRASGALFLRTTNHEKFSTLNVSDWLRSPIDHIESVADLNKESVLDYTIPANGQKCDWAGNSIPKPPRHTILNSSSRLQFMAIDRLRFHSFNSWFIHSYIWVEENELQ